MYHINGKMTSTVSLRTESAVELHAISWESCITDIVYRQLNLEVSDMSTFVLINRVCKIYYTE